MEYSRTFKSEQGVELEMRIKADRPKVEETRDVLKFISQSSHSFYLEAARLWQLGEGERERELSQENFGQMLQYCLKSHPRCKFAEGNGSSSIEKDFPPVCEESQRYPHTILADLPTKIVPILVGIATDILEVSTQSEYIKFAAMLLNEAARYNNIFSHAKEYSQLPVT